MCLEIRCRRWITERHIAAEAEEIESSGRDVGQSAVHAIHNGDKAEEVADFVRCHRLEVDEPDTPLDTPP